MSDQPISPRQLVRDLEEHARLTTATAATMLCAATFIQEQDLALSDKTRYIETLEARLVELRTQTTINVIVDDHDDTTTTVLIESGSIKRIVTIPHQLILEYPEMFRRIIDTVTEAVRDVLVR